MPVRLPRVEAILGAPIDQLTIEHIQAAVEAGVEESRDLDFKEDHYPRGNDGNDELAKDVAAFAVVVRPRQHDQLAIAGVGKVLRVLCRACPFGCSAAGNAAPIRGNTAAVRMAGTLAWSGFRWDSA
jgi:hypothetical protein